MTIAGFLQRIADARNAGNPLTEMRLSRADIFELMVAINSSGAALFAEGGTPPDIQTLTVDLFSRQNGSRLGHLLGVEVVIEDA